MSTFKFSKTSNKKFKCNDYSQSEADRLLSSISAQCKEKNPCFNLDSDHQKPIQMPVREKEVEEQPRVVAVNKVYSNNRNLHLAIKKLVEEFGATEREAGLAIENARRNKNIKYPLRHITSSKEAYEFNLKEAYAAIAKQEQVKRQNLLFEN